MAALPRARGSTSSSRTAPRPRTDDGDVVEQETVRPFKAQPVTERIGDTGGHGRAEPRRILATRCGSRRNARRVVPEILLRIL